MGMLYNLKGYHRPKDLDEAYALLKRKDVRSVVLGGGVDVVGQGGSEIEAVIDLSDLGLAFIEAKQGLLNLGAMTTLQAIHEETGDTLDGLLADTARRMAGWHVRNMATLGGTLASGDIHTPLSVALAVTRARVKIYEEPGEMPLWSELASQARIDKLRGKLITGVTVKVPDGVKGSYHQVARTPADKPIVCACAIAYPIDDGQIETYIAVGGLLRDIILIEHLVLDADPISDVEQAVAKVLDDTVLEATYLDDYLGSAEYRKSVAPVLARRALMDALRKVGLDL